MCGVCVFGNIHCICRIFQFENFKRTRNRLLRSDDVDGAMVISVCLLPSDVIFLYWQPGWYVTLHIKGVPREYAAGVDPHSHPLIITSLLDHENKVWRCL